MAPEPVKTRIELLRMCLFALGRGESRIMVSDRLVSHVKELLPVDLICIVEGDLRDEDVQFFPSAPPQHGAAVTREAVRMLLAGHSDRGEVDQTNRTVFLTPEANNESLLALTWITPEDNGKKLFVKFGPGVERGHLQNKAAKPVLNTLAFCIAQCLRMPTESGPDSEFWQQYDQFVLAVHGSLDRLHTSYIAVNDGNSLIGSDRMSILSGASGRQKLVAMTGQEAPQRRANAVRSLKSLADIATRRMETIIYDGGSPGADEDVEQRLAEYVAESRAQRLIVKPLMVKPSPDRWSEAPDGARSEPEMVIGCIVIEEATPQDSIDQLAFRTELLQSHIANALNNSETYQSLFLLPVWRTLGGILSWIRRRRKLAWLVVAGFLIALVTAMVYVEVPYRFRVTGRIFPTDRSNAFAPANAEVLSIEVYDGQSVAEGDILIQLHSDSLAIELVGAENEVQSNQRLAESLKSRLAEVARMGTRTESIEVEGELVQARNQLRAATERLKLIKTELDALTVRAPRDGTVVTFDLERRLAGRPVNRGELLMEIMSPNGPWQVEVTIPDYRVGHLLGAVSKSLNNTVDMEFVAANNPGNTLTAKIDRIGTKARTTVEEGAFIDAIGSVSSQNLGSPLIGAEVNGKITCTRTTLWYALFGDVYEYSMRHFF